MKSFQKEYKKDSDEKLKTYILQWKSALITISLEDPLQSKKIHQGWVLVNESRLAKSFCSQMQV